MAGKLMHAVQFEGYGGGAAALKHVEIPIPSPKKDEVLIKVEAASLNPIDWKIQEGVMRPVVPKFPYIPVTDFAGEVLEVGPGVQNVEVGDKVVANISFLKGGGFAEYIVAPKTLIVKRPIEVTAAEGSGLPIAGLTALQFLTDAAGIKLDGTGSPKNILITAASGGVGHYAVQLAKLGNVHVTATCGARNIDLVKSLGADEVLDYKTPEGASLKSPSGRKYDNIFNCTSGIPWSLFEPNLSERGKVTYISPSFSSMCTLVLKKLTFSKKQLELLVMSPKIENLEYLVQLVKEGKLKTVIDSKYPLSNAEDAWAKSIDGNAQERLLSSLKSCQLCFYIHLD